MGYAEQSEEMPGLVKERDELKQAVAEAAEIIRRAKKMIESDIGPRANYMNDWLNKYGKENK